MPRATFAPARRRRSPLPYILLVILILLIAAAIWLSTRSAEQPTQRIEVDVTNAALAH